MNCVWVTQWSGKATRFLRGGCYTFIPNSDPHCTRPLTAPGSIEFGEAFIHSGSGIRTNSSARDLLLENCVRTLWMISLPEEQGVSLCSGLEVVRKKNLQRVFVQIYFYWARWYSYVSTIKTPTISQIIIKT